MERTRMDYTHLGRTGLRMPSVTLSDEPLAKLDEIWPGPGGEGPVAYAS